MTSRGSARGYEPIENLSDLPHAIELFDVLRKDMVIKMDYEWEDPDTGVLMGDVKLHSEVIAEWTRGKL